LVTLDGLAYDVQVLGDFILYQDSALTVYTRHSVAGAAAVNSITELQYQDKAVITVIRTFDTAYPRVIINKVDTNIVTGTTYALPNGAGTVSVSGYLAPGTGVLYYNFDFPLTAHKATVTVHVSANDYRAQWLQVFPQPPNSVQGRTRGLLGVMNGATSDDFTDAYGDVWSTNTSVEDLMQNFVLSWATTLPYYTTIGATLEDQNKFIGVSVPKILPVATLKDFNPDTVALAQRACTGISQYDACVIDVLMANDTSYAKSYDTLQGVLGHNNFTTIVQPSSASSLITSLALLVACLTVLFVRQ